MYSLLRTKRTVFDNTTNSSLIYCCFLNEERVLALYQNGNFSVLAPEVSSVIFSDNIDKK
jgi:hypothetical protein